MRSAPRFASTRDRAAALALAVLLAAVSLACAPERPTSVLLIGDSITLGNVSRPVGEPYAKLLATELGPRFAVRNAGFGGASSGSWADTAHAGPERTRLYEAFASRNLPSDVVTVLLGTNDAIGYRGDRTEPDRYRERLSTLVDQLLADGAGRVVLMSPPPIPFARGRPDGERVAAYRDEVLALCAARDQVSCGPDVYQLLSDGDFGLLDVHPNAAGHGKIAAALAESIRSAVRQGS